MFIEIFKTMKEISEVLNNELNVAVLFEVD